MNRWAIPEKITWTLQLIRLQLERVWDGVGEDHECWTREVEMGRSVQSDEEMFRGSNPGGTKRGTDRKGYKRGQSSAKQGSSVCLSG